MTDRLQPGVPVPVAPGVVRLVAPNPGMMTGPGTNTYLVGDAAVTVIDPGPAIGRHVDAILDAVGGRIEQILVTHTHSDHSPAASLLAQRSGARLIGRPAPPGRHQDAAFAPDRVPEDGDTVSCERRALRVLHTPGHASNHLCFLLQDSGLVFTGDHIINGSTVVIDPPDGDMSAYLASLARLKDEPVTAIAPGHGEIINAPREAIEKLIAHRLHREAIVLAAVGRHPGTTLSGLVPAVYAEIDASLYPVAERSLLAHLEKLARDGRARERDGRWEAPGDR